VGRRGPIELDLIDRLGRELGHFDDSLVVLGGFGEPLLHPQLPEVLGRLRAAGVFGLTLRTNAIALGADAIDAICRHDVDVVTVLLDANSAAEYRCVHNADYFDRVRGNVEALSEARQQRGQAAPLIVPEMIKDTVTVEHMEAFYDEWLGRVGWAVIDGHSTYAGQLPDRSVLNMAPPVRIPCRRIFSRCMIMADGSMVACDRDFKSSYPVGSITSAGLSDLWRSARMQDIRQGHETSSYEHLPLCSACQDWDRP
jgi:radical SAM protein with 4Fe4S-binding SPASM domain